MLQIYNSITKRKQPFVPRIPGKIGMYVCGMTVYDYCHLGHARVLVCFDAIVRYLRQQGYEVTYVRNITDIDDKIITRALENGESVTDLTTRFIAAMNEDAATLGISPPDHEPRATEHIATIIAMIRTLLDKSYAYVASNGDVYYDVTRFANYGRLAKKDIEGQQAGARIDIVEVKRNPLDFVLWKQAKPQEPAWESPWGAGRPGWHIECSAMSTHCLGNHFDIHGGGFDLQFPHHENEIAQSEAATDETFVNVWMHIGYLQINREKMSKSLGNFFTIRDVLQQFSAEIVRYFLVSSHYRSQLNYSIANLQSAQAALQRFYRALQDLPVVEPAVDNDFAARFNTAMDDDFNTPEALAVLFDLAHQIYLCRERQELAQAAALAAQLRNLASVLGILQLDAKEFLRGDITENLEEQINALIAERNAARTAKNWAAADALRAQLREIGIEIDDTATGTTWRALTPPVE